MRAWAPRRIADAVRLNLPGSPFERDRRSLLFIFAVLAAVRRTACLAASHGVVVLTMGCGRCGAARARPCWSGRVECVRTRPSTTLAASRPPVSGERRCLGNAPCGVALRKACRCLALCFFCVCVDFSRAVNCDAAPVGPLPNAWPCMCPVSCVRLARRGIGAPTGHVGGTACGGVHPACRPCFRVHWRWEAIWHMGCRRP